VLVNTEWFSPICDVYIGEALGLLSAGFMSYCWDPSILSLILKELLVVFYPQNMILKNFALI
jgi:hypothetical protein